MDKYSIAAAIAFGTALFMAAPAYAGEDCVGLSVGHGCVGIDADDGHHHPQPSPRPHHNVAPDAGRYYYEEGTGQYRDEYPD
jgi:hypothetical protein